MTRNRLLSTIVGLSKGMALALVGLWLLIAWQEAPPGLLGKTTAIAYAVCHRLPSHSPFFGGVQFPLCFRCSGMYLGALSTWLWLSLTAPRRGGLPGREVGGVLALAFLAFAGDGLNALAFDRFGLSLYPPDNRLRLFTGLGMGLVIGAVLYPLAHQTLWREVDERPALTWRNLPGALLGLALWALALLWRPPGLLYPLAVLSTGTVLGLLTLIYAIFIVGLLRRENHATTWLDLRWPLLAGCALALTQVGLLDLARFLLTRSWVGVLP